MQLPNKNENNKNSKNKCGPKLHHHKCMSELRQVIVSEYSVLNRLYLECYVQFGALHFRMNWSTLKESNKIARGHQIGGTGYTQLGKEKTIEM